MALLGNLENMAASKVAASNPEATAVLEMIQKPSRGNLGPGAIFPQQRPGWTGALLDQHRRKPVCQPRSNSASAGLGPGASLGAKVRLVSRAGKFDFVAIASHGHGQVVAQWGSPRSFQPAANG